MNLRMFTSSVTTKLLNSGSIRYAYKVVAAFSRVEIARMERLVRTNRTKLIEAWNEYFGR